MLLLTDSMGAIRVLFVQCSVLCHELSDDCCMKNCALHYASCNQLSIPYFYNHKAFVDTRIATAHKSKYINLSMSTSLTRWCQPLVFPCCEVVSFSYNIYSIINIIKNNSLVIPRRYLHLVIEQVSRNLICI